MTQLALWALPPAPPRHTWLWHPEYSQCQGCGEMWFTADARGRSWAVCLPEAEGGLMDDVRIVVCEDITHQGEPLACGACPECGSAVTTREGIVFRCPECGPVAACSIVDTGGRDDRPA